MATKKPYNLIKKFRWNTVISLTEHIDHGVSTKHLYLLAAPTYYIFNNEHYRKISSVGCIRTHNSQHGSMRYNNLAKLLSTIQRIFEKRQNCSQWIPSNKEKEKKEKKWLLIPLALMHFLSPVFILCYIKYMFTIFMLCTNEIKELLIHWWIYFLQD